MSMLEVCLVFFRESKTDDRKGESQRIFYWVLKITFDSHFLGYGKCGRKWAILINLWKGYQEI